MGYILKQPVKVYADATIVLPLLVAATFAKDFKAADNIEHNTI